MCVLLISACLLLIAGLIPSSLLSFRKAQRIQEATLYASQVLEQLERDPTMPGQAGKPATLSNITVHGAAYQVATAVATPYAPDDSGQSYLVEVTVAWEGQPVPVHLATLYRP